MEKRCTGLNNNKIGVTDRTTSTVLPPADPLDEPVPSYKRKPSPLTRSLEEPAVKVSVISGDAETLRTYAVFGSPESHDEKDENLANLTTLLGNIAVSQSNLLMPYEEKLVVRYFNSLRLLLLFNTSKFVTLLPSPDPFCFVTAKI